MNSAWEQKNGLLVLDERLHVQAKVTLNIGPEPQVRGFDHLRVAGSSSA